MVRLLSAFIAVGSAVVVAGADDPKPPITLKAPPQLKKDTPKSEPKKPEPLKTDPAEAHALAAVLRELMQKNLPDPLSQTKQNWGNQKAVTAIHRHREGLRVWNEQVEEMRNDGAWRSISVRVPDPSKLTLAVTELTHPAEGKILATVGIIAERIDFHFEQQIWRNGVRLYAGETRGHCKGSLLIKIEALTKLDFKKGSFFPEVTLKVRATDAQLGYEDVVVDHTAGVDGEAAKFLGDAAIKLVKTFKPDLERELLEKGNAAIVRGAGTHELKASLDKIILGTKK